MNFEEYRKLFPITENYIYLDHSGVGPISLRVKEAVNNFARSSASMSGFAYEKWMEKVETSRKTCGDLIGAETKEIAFVKSTSHGISLVASGLDWKVGDNLLVYKKEFPSNIYPWLNLERKGVEIRFLEGNDGEIDFSEIKAISDENTKLLTISSVQYSNGFRADLRTIGEFCNQNNILFFVDAIQSLGIVPMDVKSCNIDFLSADGHKWMLAPEGTGVFYCANEKTELLNPSLLGWKSIVDESKYSEINFELKDNALKFEEGSLNVMGIVALGEAVSLLSEVGVANIMKRVHDFGDFVIGHANKRGFEVKSPLNSARRGGNVSFTGDFDHQKLRDKLQEKGIMVNFRAGAIRVSPHFYNNEVEIDKLFFEIDKII